MPESQWRRAITELAEEFGFFLKRKSKHMIWVNASGVIVTTSATASDKCALAQCRRQFRRSLAAAS
jgi:hypothetical protein